MYDAESTPLFPRDAHFTPQPAVIGASPTDGFYATTRRDELVWLEVALPKHEGSKLHVLGRDGTRESFSAIAPNLGDQLNLLIQSGDLSATDQQAIRAIYARQAALKQGVSLRWILAELRASQEWRYVDREVDIRLSRTLADSL